RAPPAPRMGERDHVARRESEIPESDDAASTPAAGRRRPRGAKKPAPAPTDGFPGSPDERLLQLLDGLRALEAGDFDVRLSLDGDPLFEALSDSFNRIAGLNGRMTSEVLRVSTTVGREGQMTDRASLGAVDGGWARLADSVNSLITDLMTPTTEVARVLTAVARGDL